MSSVVYGPDGPVMTVGYAEVTMLYCADGVTGTVVVYAMTVVNVLPPVMPVEADDVVWTA